MSFNQSKAEKIEGQLRRPGRSGSYGQQRGFSGGGKGGGAAAPPHSSSNPASLSSNRSSQKSVNVQGGYHRVNPANAGPVAGAFVPSHKSNVVNQASHNGAHLQAPSQGSSDTRAPSGSKPVKVSRSSRALPKAPSSQSAAVASDSAAPATPVKGNGSKQFTLQFGTISPGIMNGMQIPARTSSAPPNLDEQKRDQARHDSFRAVPTLPLPAAPRQHQEARKDGVGVKQSGPGHSHPQTQTKLDVHSQIPPSSSMALQKSSALPVAGMPMHMPFQHTQMQFQFGGPDLQIQSQGLAANSLQTPLALPVGSAPQVAQQMFIPGLHSHSIQPQALMHQGQALGFAPQMGHQLPPQLGNMGIAIGQQFAQQQSGKFRGQRKEKEGRVEEDCYILEPDACQLLTTDLERKVALADDSEDDVCIISEKGQVACRDYPHSRHLCAQYPFNSTNHENSCAQCYCYVCDERAPCELWEGKLGHCHASDKEHKWIDLRAVFRLKRKI